MSTSCKKRIIVSSIAVAGFAVSLISINANKKNPFSALFASLSPYSLTIDSDDSVTGSGTFIARTSFGNDIKFAYEDVSASAGNFGVLNDGGYILNTYELGAAHRNAIGSIFYVNVSFSGNLLLDYSWGGEISSNVYIRENIELVSGINYTFENEQPNYIRLRADGDVTISSINISYNCGTNETYPDMYIAIKNETQLKAFRDLVNETPDSCAGKIVYLTEDITLENVDFGDPIGNADSAPFSGTFDGLGHTITNLKKTTGGSLGLFSRVTKGTVKNVKMANISMIGNAQRTSGFVARAVDATIENIEILSGSIAGTTQNGGVVGVVVAGSDKTVVKNCINHASLNATSGGGNGGIVGFVHSGTLEITNCLNYGNITSSGSNTTGGILGSSSGTTTINHSYNHVDAVVRNGSTVASANNATKVGYINSGSSLGNNLGLFNEALSTASELRTFLSDSASREGEIIVISSDIDLNDVPNNDDTDYSRANIFKGTLDGLGHVINNYKSKAATAAMFKSVIGGSITNFKMKNVNVNATTQRGAAVASRFESSTVSEIEVISGSIGSVTQNAGIISAATGTVTIKDCINRASISSTGTSTGGIVAASVTAATIIDVYNCVNYGTITAGGISTGGIFGGSVSNGTGKTTIHDNVNVGDVNGTGYVGGIIGIARENAHAESLLSNCKNFGNVTGSSAVSAGGIAGLTRINIEDCECYKDINISLNKISDKAEDLSAVGGVVSGTAGGGNHRGYIAGTTGNDATAYGSLIDDTISDYEESVANANTSTNQAYGRIQTLKNGHTILTMANRISISDKEGVGTYSTLRNRDTAISKGGWGNDYVPGHEGDDDYKLWLANMEPLVLPDGRLFIFYRTDSKEATSGVYYSSIRAIESRDNGQTWLNTRHIIFENYSTDYYSDGNIRGAYEPFAILDGDTLQIFIAFDAASTRAGGLGPNNSSFICTDYYQNLLRIPVDISNMGFEVGSAAMAIKGTSTYMRPGMPSVVKLNDGNYAMILEHNGSTSDYANYAMRVAISYSHDLVTWTAPQIIITPENSGIYVGTTRYLCGAPYIQMLNNGRIAVSYTTNDYYNYSSVDMRDKCDQSYFKTVELAISDDVVSYGDTPNMTHQSAINYNDDTGARYGGCAVIGNKIILIANEYTFNESYSRVVGRGTVFSTATYY